MAPAPTDRESEMKPAPTAELRPAAEAPSKPPCMPSAELGRIQAQPFVVEHLLRPPAHVIAVAVVAVAVSLALVSVVKRYR